MNRLDLEAINSRSPYDVHSIGDQYVFVTGTALEFFSCLPLVIPKLFVSLQRNSKIIAL